MLKYSKELPYPARDASVEYRMMRLVLDALGALDVLRIPIAGK
jgi:hypothetical protein